MISVHTVARDRMVGALSFIRHAETQDPSEVATVEDLGRRAAAAVDIGRLFGAAQRAIVLREEFAAVSAHELRTPLTAIKLALQSLSRRARKSRAEEGLPAMVRMLEIAERQAVGLHRLVDTLLDVSSIATGSLAMALSEVDLTEAVRSAVAESSDGLRASGSALTLDVHEPVVGQWDRARLEQVVAHLLSNAIRFGEGRPIEIAVRGEKDVARLIVRDHGMGMTPEVQQRGSGASNARHPCSTTAVSASASTWCSASWSGWEERWSARAHRVRDRRSPSRSRARAQVSREPS